MTNEDAALKRIARSYETLYKRMAKAYDPRTIASENDLNRLARSYDPDVIRKKALQKSSRRRNNG